MDESITWIGYEHEHTEKSADWYWALGTIAVSSALTSVAFGNILFAILIITAAIALAAVASREPTTIEFKLSEKGLQTGETPHPFSEIKAFWIEETRYPEPVLFVDTLLVMTPHLMIPLATVDHELVRAYFKKKKIQEIPLSEPFSHKILELLGF